MNHEKIALTNETEPSSTLNRYGKALFAGMLATIFTFVFIGVISMLTSIVQNTSINDSVNAKIESVD